MTHAAGWYADPDDPALIRYWDGRAWTEQRRPRPSWAGPGRSGPVGAGGAPATPDPRRARRRRWLFGALTGVGAVGLLAGLVLLVTAPKVHVPARSVRDRAFTRSANELCRAMMPAVREQRPQLGSHQTPASARRLADQVDHTASSLSSVEADLRGLPVAPADRPEVERWLDDWNEYVAVGHRYADALRTGNEARYNEVAAEGDRPGRSVYVFAVANGMRECTF